MDIVTWGKLAPTLNTTQRRRWPKLLAEKVRRADRDIFDQFPEDTPIFLLHGKEDPLVPTFYTDDWLRRRREQGKSTENAQLFVQEKTGHSCTKEMIGLITGFLQQQLRL
jgi:predicted esterase